MPSSFMSITEATPLPGTCDSQCLLIYQYEMPCCSVGTVADASTYHNTTPCLRKFSYSSRYSQSLAFGSMNQSIRRFKLKKQGYGLQTRQSQRVLHFHLDSLDTHYFISGQVVTENISTVVNFAGLRRTFLLKLTNKHLASDFAAGGQYATARLTTHQDPRR